jgi:hypothetical protein
MTNNQMPLINMTRYYAFLVLFLILASGCKVSDEPFREDAELSEATFFLTPTFFASAKSGGADLHTDPDRFARANLSARIAFDEAAILADGWADADARVLTTLNELDGTTGAFHRSVLDQIASVAMLRHGGWENEGSEVDERLAHYVSLLVENASPEATLVRPALERLAGHWSEEKIAEAAGVVGHSALERVQELRSCDKCASSAKMKSEVVGKAWLHTLAELEANANELLALANTR